MSYSRWTDSVWYTFWCVSDSDKKEEQLFDICNVATFTYQELKDDMNKCIQHIKEQYPDDYSDLDYEEVKIYIKRFLKDVDVEYEANN